MLVEQAGDHLASYGDDARCWSNWRISLLRGT